MIQPRVVRAIAEQNSDKSPESALEKQLRCNPSFTPRILSCPPYSHNLRPINMPNPGMSNTSVDTLVPSTSSFNNITSLGALSLNSSTSTLKPSLPLFSRGLNYHSAEHSGSFHHSTNLETLNEDCLTSGDEEQKFHSLDAKKDHCKPKESQFSSMKVVRKRKLDRCYPSTRQIDYIMIDKKQLNPKNGQLDMNNKETPKISKDVIYANFPSLFSSAISSPEVGMMTNSLTSESMNVSFQNLTDSIQIYENSPADKSKKLFSPNRSDSKTPTPAPRTIKSPITPDKNSNKTSKEHVYANFSLRMIGSETNDNRDLIKKPESDVKTQCFTDDKSNFRSAFMPISETPKTLPRKFLKTENISEKISQKSTSPKKCHPSFNSLTFPKRTTKSGILFDKNKDITVKEKTVGVKEGKVISSKTPSRASSFNEPTVQLNLASSERTLNLLTGLDDSKNDKKDSTKISPSIVDATPKVKPFIVNSILSNVDNLTPLKQNLSFQNFAHNSHFNMRPRIIVETSSAPLHSKSNESVSKDLLSNESMAKVIPKQQMLIQPAKVPLQIPNLLPKPIPKIHPVQKQAVRRSQSSVSSKGASEYRQSCKNPSSDVHDGSLVRAKIRELNLRQVILIFHHNKFIPS